MTLVYVAQAVDRDAPQIPAKFEEVLDWLRHDFVLYRPASAFTVPPGGVGTDSCVRDVNMAGPAAGGGAPVLGRPGGG